MLFAAIYLISKLRCILMMKSEKRKTLTTLNNYTFASRPSPTARTQFQAEKLMFFFLRRA